MVNFGRSKSTLNRVPFSQSPYQQSGPPPLPMNVRRRSVRVVEEAPEPEEYVMMDNYCCFWSLMGQFVSTSIRLTRSFKFAISLLLPPQRVDISSEQQYLSNNPHQLPSRFFNITANKWRIHITKKRQRTLSSHHPKAKRISGRGPHTALRTQSARH